MTTYALASEYHLLTPAQKDQVEYLIIDNGIWTEEMINNYIATTFVSDIETERREGWMQ